MLLGNRSGDNNQALALAEALGQPFEIRHLRYSPLAAASVLLPPTLATLKRGSRRRIAPPWPDLVICVGRRSEPIARWIKRKSGGRARLVRIGNPRIDPAEFDLIVTTRQYPPPQGANVLLLPFTLGRSAEPPHPNPRERGWLDSLGSPFRLVAVGGTTKYWRLCEQEVERAIDPAAMGLCVVTTSRRTDPRVVAHLRDLAEGDDRICLVTPGFPRFEVLLDAASEVYVTGDSVSMLSESIAAGKKTAIIPIVSDRLGRAKLGDAPSDEGRDAHRRDLRRFWDYLVEQGLAGTLESGARRARRIPQVNAIAAKAVKALLGDRR